MNTFRHYSFFAVFLVILSACIGISRPKPQFTFPTSVTQATQSVVWKTAANTVTAPVETSTASMQPPMQTAALPQQYIEPTRPWVLGTPTMQSPLPASTTVISQTIEAGLQELPHAPSAQVSAIAFADSQHGWVASPKDIFATVDGGLHWEWLSEIEDEVHALDFISFQHGWAATDQGLLVTQDGGNTWQPVPISVGGTPQSVDMQAVDFTGPQRGWVGLDTFLLQTTDGGKSWEQLDLPCDSIERYSPDATKYSSFSLLGEKEAWLLCGGQPAGENRLTYKWLFKTTDDGQTWQLVNEYSPDKRRDGLPAPGHSPDLFFLDNNHGWMAAQQGGLFQTSDGGKSWAYLDIPLHDLSTSFPQYFTPEAGVFLASVGNRSFVLATVDKNASLTQLFPPLLPVEHIQFTGPLTGYGVGTNLEPTALLESVDGGKTWDIVGTVGEKCSKQVLDLDFVDPKNAWAILAGWCDNRQVDSMIRTEDAGKSWSGLPRSDFDYAYNSLSFVDSLSGFVGAGYGGHLYVTNNRGLTWQEIMTTDALGERFQFIDLQHGWKTRNYQLFATNDGGVSWSLIPLKYYVWNFDLVSPESAWVWAGECSGGGDCTPVLLSTGNGGISWTLYDFGGKVKSDLSSKAQIDFLDAWVGWIFLDNHLYFTRDGGLAWVQIR